MIIGAGTGFVTGGPFGAAIGAAAGLIVGEARSQAAMNKEIAERESE